VDKHRVLTSRYTVTLPVRDKHGGREYLSL